MKDCMLVKEVADVLAEHGELRCRPEVSQERGDVTLTLTLSHAEQDDIRVGFDTLALYDDLRYAVDVCQMRAFASRYGIDPAALEALLPKKENVNGR